MLRRAVTEGRNPVNMRKVLAGGALLWAELAKRAENSCACCGGGNVAVVMYDVRSLRPHGADSEEVGMMRARGKKKAESCRTEQAGSAWREEV